MSTSRIVAHGRTVELEINALGRDYEKAANVRIVETNGEVNPVALAVMAPAILSYVDDHVAVLAGGERCSPGPASAKPADTHVLITMAWTCPPEGELRYRVTLFQDVDPAARHLAVIASEHGERELAIDKNAPEIALSGEGASVAGKSSAGLSRPASSTSFWATTTSPFCSPSSCGAGGCGR